MALLKNHHLRELVLPATTFLVADCQKAEAYVSKNMLQVKCCVRLMVFNNEGLEAMKLSSLK